MKKILPIFLLVTAPALASDFFTESAINAEIANINERIEDLLIPLKPTENLWAAQRVSVTVSKISRCPFETNAECEIWRTKPAVRESVQPRVAKLSAQNMNALVRAACINPNITANNPLAAGLLGRYKLLLKSARACCTDGMVYRLKQSGGTDAEIYEFLIDDANGKDLGGRCLMMTPGQETSKIATDVRMACLCHGRDWFTAMLAPFRDVWRAAPQFANAAFNYTYDDGLGRTVTVSINDDVKNILNQLELCP